MSIFNHPSFLRSVLLIDATTCFATGLLMTLGAKPVGALTQIPTMLLVVAGLSLLPVAVFMAFIATRGPGWSRGVWLIVLGNAAWVAGSLLLLGGLITPNTLGTAFILVQALTVAVLLELEIIGLRRMTA